jgi:hypothetical protein
VVLIGLASNDLGRKASKLTTKSHISHISHKMPQNATKRHKIFVARKFREKEVFFVKSFGRDRLIVSNGKTGKCHFVATLSFVLMAQLYLIGTREDHTPHSVVDFSRF